jgi:hypothetical protein
LSIERRRGEEEETVDGGEKRPFETDRFMY